jgi:hypothetical protein
VDPREGIENAIGVLRDLVGAPAAKGAGLDGVVVEGSGGGVQQSQLGGWVDGWVDERLEVSACIISRLHYSYLLFLVYQRTNIDL